ncbi:MAG: ORF6N domain-containing protein [Rhodospirillales bacterium]|jgi:hypothetical protein|nr:ORF6N domain-containing protein [Rhodospirillales bacterium]
MTTVADMEMASLTLIEDKILTLRGQKIMLDHDLARLYGVATKALNQAVKRNRGRFPAEFAFVLTPEEFADLRSHAATGSAELAGGMRSQIVTASKKRNVGHPPIAFTEHGAIMAATVLNSPKAVEMSVFIVKAFVRMRQALLSRHDLEKRLDQIEKVLLVHDDALKDLYQKLRPLLLPPPGPERKPIGFGVKEPRAAYRSTRKSRP